MSATFQDHRLKLYPFAKVSFDEITFATALFLAAAEGRLAGSAADLTEEQEQDCWHLFATLVSEPGVQTREPEEYGQAVAQRSRPALGSQLYNVFRALWSHLLFHRDHPDVCARVLAFHLLMERTWGAAIDGWSEPLEGEEAYVGMHPAVVHAIGQVPLHRGRALRAADFRQQILQCHLADSYWEPEPFGPAVLAI